MDEGMPASLLRAVSAYEQAQAGARGDWRSPREIVTSGEASGMPSPPYPGVDNPVLEFLRAQARISLRGGVDPETVVLQAIVHGWMEGHIEGYDHGQREARALRPI